MKNKNYNNKIKKIIHLAKPCNQTNTFTNIKMQNKKYYKNKK